VERDFASFLDPLNAGEPIPQVEFEDMRAALRLPSEARAILDSAAQRGIISALAVPTVGFGSDDLASRYRPEADVFPVVLRALASEILRLSRTNPERLGPYPDAFLMQAMATIALLAAEDTPAILVHIDELRSVTRSAPEH
jgi:hypothetical protein